MKIKSQSLIKGTMILMLSGLITKILGFGLRIYLVRVIGDEGLGLFQMIFPIFVTSSIIMTLGLPVAVAKFVARSAAQKQYNKALKIFELSIITVLFSSLVVTFFIIKQADFITATFLEDQRTYYTLLAISPALFFTGLASIMRGFFQGLRIMTPTALARIIEQVARLIATVLILVKLSTAALEFKVTGVALGVSIGEIIAFVFLAVIFFYYLPQVQSLDNNPLDEPKLKILIRLFKFGIPITCGKLVASLMYTLEAITIPTQLQKIGLSTSEATSFYGQLSGMVQQLIMLPTIMTIALNSNLVPAVSEALAADNEKQIRSQAHQAIRLTFYFGLLAVIILSLVPHQICALLFNYPEAGDILQILSFTAVFLYLGQIFASILHGLGQPTTVVRNSIIALFIELLLIQGLIYLPHKLAVIIICGAIGLRFIITASLNYLTINHSIKLKLPFYHIFIKPLLAGLIVIITLPTINQWLYTLSNNRCYSLLTALTISSLSYIATLIILKGITKDDLAGIKFF